MSVDVIVPVYKGAEDLRQCVESLLTANCIVEHNIYLINDASPEPAVTEYLARLKDDQRVVVLDNRENRGFVATVNRGMALNPKHNVVLLNSDTIVPPGWLDRLTSCAGSQRNVATVTPFSNNATICSFPGFCQDNELLFDQDPQTIDACFQSANPKRSITIPTAVGFCMYIARECLDQIGLFDVETFGRGYGEENDFCLRATARGWRHLLCADLFVYHKGKVSFGDEHNTLTASAIQKIHARYPSYQRLIDEHITSDPAARLRSRALLELVRNTARQKVVYIVHSRGGGTEKHLADLIQLFSDQILPLILRPDEQGGVLLELPPADARERVSFHLPAQWDLLCLTLKFLNAVRIHYHHTMGHHPLVMELGAYLNLPYDITLHDYYCINANPSLIDHNGLFCPEKNSRDQACQVVCPIPGHVTATQWRQSLQPFLAGAQRVFCPSRFLRDLFRDYFPDLAYVMAYHADFEQDVPYPAVTARRVTGGAPLCVLVLGALSPEKGADIVERVAVTSRKRDLPLKFSLLGYAYRGLSDAIEKRGPYRDHELDRLLQESPPDLVWFPATCPESYSYTLSAVLRAGLPVLVPDIGAFPERIANRPWTWVANYASSTQEWLDALLAVHRNMCLLTEPAQTTAWRQRSVDTMVFSYHRHYVIGGICPSQPAELRIEELVFLDDKPGKQTCFHLWYRRALFALRESRLGVFLQKSLPIGVQKKVKRLLFAKGFEEITNR